MAVSERSSKSTYLKILPNRRHASPPHPSLPLSLLPPILLLFFTEENQSPERLSHCSNDTQPGNARLREKSGPSDSQPDSCLQHLTRKVNFTDHVGPRLNSVLSVSVRMFPEISI